MSLIFIALFLGVALGYLLQSVKIRGLSKMVLITIFVLLFVMGIQVGADKNIISNFGSIGFKAISIAAGSILGGSILVRLLQNWIDNK